LIIVPKGIDKPYQTTTGKYSITGSKIRIFLFENRLEVISPGRLPNTVTIEKLRFGVSFAINPVIVKFMENMHYIDQLGRGAFQWSIMKQFQMVKESNLMKLVKNLK